MPRRWRRPAGAADAGQILSRTNVYVLIATGLLGVLLVVVYRLAGQADVPPVTVPLRDAAPAPAPPSATAGLPRVADATGLSDRLARRGLDAPRLLAAAASWYRQLGFTGALPLLGVTAEASRSAVYAAMDDAGLRALAAREPGAAQALAARLAPTEPFAALALYRQAAGQDSVYAQLQAAQLQASFARVAEAGLATDAAFSRQLAALGESADAIRAGALATALAAVRDGGPPVVDGELLAWLQALAGGLDPARREAACRSSLQIFLDAGTRRREQGRPPVRVNPPAVFLAIPDLATALPCGEGSAPVDTLLDLTGCGTEAVADGAGALRTLYVCATG